MEQDKFALVEKILKDVDFILSKKAQIYSFDIVPVDSNYQNKSPVLYVDNCLGIESWCIKHVYMHSYSKIMERWLPKAQRRPLKITSFNADELLKPLNLVLLLNPDVTTFWNKRRDIFLLGFLNSVNELRFCKLVLSRKPKSNDAFAYRRWILNLIWKDIQNDPQFDSIIAEELNTCKMSAERSPNNYHSWSHRIWLMKQLAKLQTTFYKNLLGNEFLFSLQWISTHVSDFSCFHYREFIIKNVISMSDEHWKQLRCKLDFDSKKPVERFVFENVPGDGASPLSARDLNSYCNSDLIDLLLSDSSKSCNCPVNKVEFYKNLEIIIFELLLSNDLIRFYKLHETLWYHRRYVIHEFMSNIYDCYGLTKVNNSLVKLSCSVCQPEPCSVKQPKMVRYDTEKVHSSNIFKMIIKHEQSFISEQQNAGDSYADKHAKYLKFVENMR